MIKHVRAFSFTCVAFPASSHWGKCMQSFLSQIHRKSYSLSSQHAYSATLERFFSESPCRLPHLYTREDVEAFITLPGTANGRNGTTVLPGSVNNRLTILSSFYHYAASYGVQGEDGMLYPLMPYLPPTAGIRYAKRAISGSKALSDEDLRRFFAAIPRDTLQGKRDYAMFLMYFWCARRCSEITLLQWRDLEKTLIVDSTGSHMAWVYRFYGKGKKTVADFAELPPVAASALFSWLEASERLATMEPDDFLFTSLPDYRGRLGYDPKRPLVSQQVWWNAQQYAARGHHNIRGKTHAKDLLLRDSVVHWSMR